MSEIKVSKLTNRAGTGAPDFSQGVKISGTASTLLAPTRTEEALSASSDWTVSLSDVSYDSVSFSVGTQSGNPTGAVFNHDGTKIYVITPTQDAIFQYGLSTAYDLSTASYDNKSFSVGTQESTAYGLTVNNDTTKVYITGISTDYIYEYDLSTASDISTASYNSVSLNISSQDGNSRGITFNNDGTKIFMCGAATDSVYQYNLTTAYDLSTASYASSSFDVSSQTTAPLGLKFNPDGTQLFVIGNNQYVFQYSLTTGYDLSTASYDSVSFYTNAFETGPQDIFFSADGTKLFIVGNVNDKIYQLSTGATAAAAEPENPANGDTWWNPTDETYDVYINNEWKRFIGASASTGIAWGGDRHLALGGYVTGNMNNISYFSATDTTSLDFGDLTVARYSAGSVSNQTRCVALGGYNSNVLDYITVATTGNATDFGDTNQSASYNAYVQSAGDGTYGVYVGNGATAEYITIATTGNASQFGSIGTSIYGSGGGGDGTYGIFTANASTSAIRYITIGTSGSGAVFGNLLNTAAYAGLCSDNTYTLIQRGTGTDVEYITTATTGNSSDFGDLTVAKTFSSMSSDGTYGISAGTYTTGNTTVMDKFTIATTGNATDMGDLATAHGYHTQSSGSSS